MSETHNKIQAGVDRFMAKLEEATVKALDAQCDGLEMSSEVAALMARAAMQRVTLEAVLKQRGELEKLVANQPEGTPMRQLVDRQIADVDAIAVKVMGDCGIPERATRKVLSTLPAEWKPGGGRYVKQAAG